MSVSLNTGCVYVESFIFTAFSQRPNPSQVYTFLPQLSQCSPHRPSLRAHGPHVNLATLNVPHYYR